MWSRKFNQCVSCNTTIFPHIGRGLCYKCYNKELWEKIKNNPIKHKEHLKRISKKYHSLPKNKKRQLGKLNRELRYFSGKREFVLQRDKYQCIKCGEKNNLVVHHIDKKGDRKNIIEYNNKFYNLVTLCRKCHLQIHFIGHSYNKLPENKWSKKYECCIKCKTTKTPHNSNGLCNNCYAKNLRILKKYKLPSGKWKLRYSWHNNYSKCRKCNTNFRKHEAHGLCCNCYVYERTHNRLNLWIT